MILGGPKPPILGTLLTPLFQDILGGAGRVPWPDPVMDIPYHDPLGCHHVSSLWDLVMGWSGPSKTMKNHCFFTVFPSAVTV